MSNKIKLQKELRSKRRKYVLDLFGNKCNKCNSTEKLEFNHINRFDKTCEISELLSSNLNTLKTELQKCELLCQKCHKAYTKQQFDNKEIIPWNKNMEAPYNHGTARMYTRKGCRCILCKEAKRLYRNGKIDNNEVINPNKLT